MDAAECLRGIRREHDLLSMLTETVRGLEAVRCSCRRTVGGGTCMGEEPGGGEGGGGGGGGGEETEGESEGGRLSHTDGADTHEERSEKKCKQKVLALLRQLTVYYADGVTAWREAVRECADMMCPLGGSDQRHPPTAVSVLPCPDSFSETVLSVGEDIQSITDTLNFIIARLDEEVLKLCTTQTPAVDAARIPGGPEQPVDSAMHPEAQENNGFENGHKQDSEDANDSSYSEAATDTEQTSDSRLNCSNVDEGEEELVVSSLRVHDEDVSPENQRESLEEANGNDKGEEEANNEWIAVKSTGHREDGGLGVADACFVSAPADVAELLRCEAADALSGLMVSGTEELLSRVVRVKGVADRARVRLPVTLAVPFSAGYRGNYRDLAVKVVDGERRASYLTPVTREGTYGGHRGSFAEVRVYSLGLFAVVSCLKRENYTVPKKGLSLKLPVDSRICLNYLPGSFTAPVMAQIMIQPVDAVLLAAVKSRCSTYHSVVSTSPLLYLSHPSSQPLRRPLTLTLPCPPNPNKKRLTACQRENQDRPLSGSPTWDQPASHKRILGISAKPKETSDELLVVLGSRDKQWSVLDKVTVRNQQNGLVSFELTEKFDRLLVVRFLSPLHPCHLPSLAEELEESLCCQAVTVILQRRQDEPHAVLVAALPSRDLSWELSKLRAQGYKSVPQTSPEISMCEGDQLLLRFSGNITSTGTPKDQVDAPHERITFHNQQKNQLLVHLTEVDPFGNYSSPHYKGAAMFYKVSRGQLQWTGDKPVAVDTALLGDPVCKLSLTLPKKVKIMNRPIVARVKLCEETDSLPDSLLLWLSGELSEEEVALLVLSLRLRRSAAQLVKLRAGDDLSTQAFHVLAMWRRGLPAVTHQPKASQLAQSLAKSGRPDLARELLLRQAAATRRGSLSKKSRNPTTF